MIYERPSIEERRDITAQLTQGVQTSGNRIVGANPTWRKPEKG